MRDARYEIWDMGYGIPDAGCRMWDMGGGRPETGGFRPDQKYLIIASILPA